MRQSSDHRRTGRPHSLHSPPPSARDLDDCKPEDPKAVSLPEPPPDVEIADVLGWTAEPVRIPDFPAIELQVDPVENDGEQNSRYS
jgi:hypothetical protein